MKELSIALATETAELEALAPIEGWAFGFPATDALEWLKGAGSGRVRVAREGARVVGGLLEIPMGQWFGGKSVTTLGLAGVAVAPETRGRGLALRLIQQTLRAARERGFALSTLYPSTFGLYRKAGYELGGSYCRFNLQLRRLPRSRSKLEITSLSAEEHAEVAQLYGAVARHRPGYLDRGDYIWQRVRRPHGEVALGFGVRDNEGLAGYLMLKPNKGMPIQFAVTDFVTRTPEAFETLLGLLADHGTTAESASWKGGPADARLLGLPDRVVKVEVEDYWMLRLLNVPAALLARGYPHIDAAVEIAVDDAFLPENEGRHALVVEQGQPRLASGGDLPFARLSAGSLAALYSGFIGAHELRLTGKLDADERAVQALAALFAGPAPGIADYF
ncbi:MAG TPA: GNAT family N-acetyltransferase [Polyangiaceae bacterium]